MTHLLTRSKLARLVRFTHHRPKCSLKTTIPCSQTFTFRQFSKETDANSGRTKSPEPEHRRVELPKELSKDVIVLSCESTAKGGVCDVYVFGTNHISEESSKQAEAIVKFLKPEIVFLELCRSGRNVLFREKIKVLTSKDVWELLKKKRNIFSVLYYWDCAKKYNELDLNPGAEFRSAYREAIKYGGKVVLGDRPIQITIKRTWRKLPLWHVIKYLFSPSYGSKTSFSSSDDVKRWLKECSERDLLTWRQIRSEKLPTVMETIVHERDQYMCYELLKVASESRTIVAVVGRDHLQGMQKNWKQPINIRDLITIPPPKPLTSVMRIIASVGVVLTGIAIIPYCVGVLYPFVCGK
ncbi:uncharacterized protein [Cicer arietinum]|uniref:TraB domain-containing protein-like n=1 Tax=Cicer arietinum TaxID=3827 RepID=A0A1S2Z2V3_CICAR|nr:traB domain-containing protein-like [Cicer arietinum]